MKFLHYLDFLFNFLFHSFSTKMKNDIGGVGGGGRGGVGVRDENLEIIYLVIRQT